MVCGLMSDEEWRSPSRLWSRRVRGGGGGLEITGWRWTRSSRSPAQGRLGVICTASSASGARFTGSSDAGGGGGGGVMLEALDEGEPGNGGVQMIDATLSARISTPPAR